MDAYLLEILCCPFCRSQLRFEGGPTGSERGILACPCHRYPVLSGIPIIKDGEASRGIIDDISRGRAEASLARLVRPQPAQRGPGRFGRVGRYAARTWANVTSSLQARGQGLLLVEDENRSFADAARLLYEPDVFNYFFYRFSDPTFLTALAISQAIPPDRPVLDLACGIGHLSYALTQWRELGPIVGLDRAFRALYLARRFILPEGRFVCCEADLGLPFREGAFTTVFTSDAFHYILPKALLASEMLRVTDDAGLLLLPHLHVHGQVNMAPGWPLSPGRYAALFEGLSVQIFGDASILHEYLRGHPIDLSRGAEAGAVSSEASISLVAAKDPGALRAYGPKPLAFRPDRLVVNPLYRRIDGEGRKYRLTLPGPVYEAEYGKVREYLPAEVSLSEEMLQEGAKARSVLEPLVRSFVLLDLPPRYL